MKRSFIPECQMGRHCKLYLLAIEDNEGPESVWPIEKDDKTMILKFSK